MCALRSAPSARTHEADFGGSCSLAPLSLGWLADSMSTWTERVESTVGNSLQGRVAVVTGASRGIGAAVAQGFAEAGASVVGIARQRPLLEQVSQRVAATEGAFEGVVADVTDEQSLASAFETAANMFGGIDIVVANAGISPSRSDVAQAGAEEWTEVLATNVIGVASTIRVAVPYLIDRSDARIITLGSGLGQHGLPGFGVYASSKAALTRLTQVAATELARFGIAVNELIPGPVTEDADAAAQPDSGTVASVFREEWNKQPEDVVPLALYLATQPSPGPTGQTFSLMRR